MSNLRVGGEMLRQRHFKMRRSHKAAAVPCLVAFRIPHTSCTQYATAAFSHASVRRCAADQEGQLDSERLLGISRAGDVVGRHVGAHNLEHRRLDVLIGDALDVTIANLLVPNLKRLGTEERRKDKTKKQSRRSSCVSLSAARLYEKPVRGSFLRLFHLRMAVSLLLAASDPME